jgi:hypothetical protein
VARALEKWGGGPALADLIGLQVRTGRKKSKWNVHVQNVASSTGLQGKDLFEEAAATYDKEGAKNKAKASES